VRGADIQSGNYFDPLGLVSARAGPPVWIRFEKGGGGKPGNLGMRITIHNRAGQSSAGHGRETLAAVVGTVLYL